MVGKTPSSGLSATHESRAFEMVALQCGEDKAKQVPIAQLTAAVQKILRAMSSGLAEVLRRRHGLDNESPPISDLNALAQRIGSTVTATSRYLLRAEEQMRTALRSEFPVLMADPDPTPQTH